MLSASNIRILYYLVKPYQLQTLEYEDVIPSTELFSDFIILYYLTRVSINSDHVQALIETRKSTYKQLS